MDDSEEGIQELTKRLENASSRLGTEINTEKSKVMIVGGGDEDAHPRIKVQIGGEGLEQVSTFTYLGATIEENGKSKKGEDKNRKSSKCTSKTGTNLEGIICNYEKQNQIDESCGRSKCCSAHVRVGH